MSPSGVGLAPLSAHWDPPQVLLPLQSMSINENHINNIIFCFEYKIIIHVLKLIHCQHKIKIAKKKKKKKFIITAPFQINKMDTFITTFHRRVAHHSNWFVPLSLEVQ